VNGKGDPRWAYVLVNLAALLWASCRCALAMHCWSMATRERIRVLQAESDFIVL